MLLLSAFIDAHHRILIKPIPSLVFAVREIIPLMHSLIETVLANDRIVSSSNTRSSMTAISAKQAHRTFV